MSRVLTVIALAMIASAAHAQTTTASNDEMLVSGPATAPPPAATVAKPATTSRPLTADEQIKAWISDAPKLDHAASNVSDLNAPRQVHGSAGVAVGSNGYRSAYVSSLIPVGRDGTLGIAVSQADYGGGTFDHGRIALPRGRSQSLAISLDLSHGQGNLPADCPGFRDGDRYIEPVWMSRLHPEMSCSSETDTHAETDTFGQ